MKVQGITLYNYKNNITNIDAPKNSPSLKYSQKPDIFVKNTPAAAIQNPKTNLNPISFMGYSVHIVDGGDHATNMNHFAHSISDKWDLYNRETKTVPGDKNVKSIEDVEWKLKELNFQQELSFDKDHDVAYIAIPVLANVPLQNLQAQMRAVTGSDIRLTPDNVKTKKKEIINFLKMLYENPDRYREYINYMDPMGQGLEKTYGVIYQINKLNEHNNIKVYVPAGHPEYNSIKWITEQRNLKPELYNYIATKNDRDNVIHHIQDEIKNDGWYDFNLLSLSDAEVVNLKDTSGSENYIYSAYDSCINNGARGVYNFTPVRGEDGSIKGYSYHDDKTIDYPYNEFPGNDEIKNIARFVGRPLNEVLADKETTQAFKDAVWDNRSREPFADKLFRVEDIFPQHERDYNKMDLKGDYIDSSLQLFFRKNDAGQVIFPECDCEGSGRPSVVSMWGSCFSIFNAIKNDIAIREKFNAKGYNNKEILYSEHPRRIANLMKDSANLIKNRNFVDAEQLLQDAVELEKIAGLHGFKPLEALGDLYTRKRDYIKAERCYNSALNELSKQIMTKMHAIGKDVTLDDCAQNATKFEELQKQQLKYVNAKQAYDKQGYLQKMFSSEPEKPKNAEPYRKYAEIFNLAKETRRLYIKLSENCEMRDEDYPAFACNWAAEMLRYPTGPHANELIRRRAENNTYLGDFLHVD